MLHEVRFDSFNGRDKVLGWIYVPACEHRGIVQLVHGFGEHSRRYFHMIVALMDAGFVVAADDHVGHGATAVANDTWGDWGDAGPHTMMEDEKLLHDLVVEKYPDLPYFMFGHSMGSMIARDFSTKYGGVLTGAVYCSTTGKFAGAAARDIVDAAVRAGKAHEADPSYTTALFGGMFGRIDEGVTRGNE
ncbi:MAG: alpha/beta hydrolase, partial [Atopobiaceae bacterium]|nr:alpha/beta hydrolase [Atopobiaceae bacterium]